MEWASTRILLHVTCQRYTKNFYIAQHFKIKGIFGDKDHLIVHPTPENELKCRSKTTVIASKKIIQLFHEVSCRWNATFRNSAVGEWLQGRINCRKQKTPPKRGSKLVGERGFEPPTHWSQTSCATKLRYSPMYCFFEFLVQFILKVVVRGGGLEPPHPKDTNTWS